MDLQERVHQIAHMQEKIILQAEQVLVLLAAIPAVRQGTPEAEELFAASLKKHQEYDNLVIADRQGKILRSALPLEHTSTIEDQFYFQKARQTKRLAIGLYQVNQVSQKPTLGQGYPILDQTGQVTGIVVVVLDLDWLQDLTSTFQDLPEESITVLDSDGTVLAHVPEPGRFVGQRLQNEAIIKTILNRKEGTTVALGLDRRERLYAFTPWPALWGLGMSTPGCPPRSSSRRPTNT